jgi:sugar (pentulose or hexulose) kinase
VNKKLDSIFHAPKLVWTEGFLLNNLASNFRNAGHMIAESGPLRWGLISEDGTAYWRLSVGGSAYSKEVLKKARLAADQTAASLSGGLLFFPYLLGEKTLGSAHSRASFVGATLRHGRAHFARAVMERITLEDCRALKCLCPVGVQGPIRCSGGGASSSLWNQIRADVFANPVQVLASAEGGIQGAAILAGVAAGWYSDAAAGAEEVVRVAETWAPSPDAVRVYEDAFGTFCAVHDALDDQWRGWDDRMQSWPTSSKPSVPCA